MRVTVKLYASLRKYQPDVPRGAELPVDVAPGTTVGQVVEQLGIPDKAQVVVMVNTMVRKMEHVLVEGDKLKLFPPVAGG